MHFQYAGPLLHCVVWHDGTHWRAALDTQDMYEPGSGKGNLADFEPLTDYRTELKYGTFSKEDGCNFVCNIYEEGNVLSIVVDSGSHGTHVAGITSAYSPDNPGLNGIAPGGLLCSFPCKLKTLSICISCTFVECTAVVGMLRYNCLWLLMWCSGAKTK